MSTRAELKENLLAARVEAAVTWILANRVAVLTTAGILLGTILVLSVVSLRRREAAEFAATQLAQAQALIAAGRPAEARPLLSQLRTSAPSAELEAQIIYYEGVAALETGDLSTAVTLLSDAARLAGNGMLTPLALSNLAFAQEEKGEYEAAIQTYQRFMASYADNFLAPRIQIGMGRSLILAGRLDEARKALEQLIDLYPTSEWAEKARSLMDKNKVR